MDTVLLKLADWIVPLCMEKGLKKKEEALEVKKITGEFQDYLSHQEKYNELCSRAEEIDFEGFVEYISNNLIDDIRACLIDTDTINMEGARQRILEKAFRYSYATTPEAKERVSYLIFNCMEILKGFYRSRMSIQELITIDEAAKATARQVSMTLQKDYSHTKQEEEKQHKRDLHVRLADRLKEAWSEEMEHSPSMMMAQLHASLFPTVKFVSVESQVKVEGTTSVHYSEKTTLQDAIQSSWKDETPKNISLFGIGGLGKTASLLSLQLPVMMVYIPLRALSNVLTIEKYILDNTLKSDHELYDTFLCQCNKCVQNQPNVLLVLDGLNEIDSKVKTEVKREITSTWIRKHAQIIISSRYDSAVDFPLMDMLRFRLELLSKEQVEAYLRSVQLPLPDPYSRLWRVLNTPLMLNLYAHGELVKQHYQNVIDISLRPSMNAGSIIWNYLQSEIYRCAVSYENIAITTIAAEYVAPFIAFEMQTNGDHGLFSLTDERMFDSIEKAIAFFNGDKKAHQLPNHLREVLSRNPCEISAPILREVLIEKMCLFVHIEGTVQFMHQHFRDALAALRLYQSACTAIDQFPNIWSTPIDEYVSDFLADYLESDRDSFDFVWAKLWTIFQRTINSCSSIRSDSFVKTMLDLYRKAYGTDISRINFSGFDLTHVSLLGFRLDGSTADHFIGTKVGTKTICGDGHRMMVCSLSWDSENTAYLSASHDCTLRIWNEKTQENVKINSDEVHKHYIRCAQWCPGNNDLIASAGDDKQIILWNYNGGIWKPNCIGTCKDWIYSICWNLQGDWLFCGDRIGNVCAFSVCGEKKTYNQQHANAIGCIASKPDGLFATGDDDGLVCIWAQNDNLPKLTLNFNGAIKAIQWANQNSILAVFTNDSFYYIDYQHLFESGKKDWKEGCDLGIILSGHEQGICTAVIGSIEDTDYCAILFRHYILITKGFRDRTGKYQIFRIVSKEISEEDIGIASCAVWDQACFRLIIGSRNGSIWQAILLQQEDTFERLVLKKISNSNNNSARCSAWSGTGTILAAGYDDGKIRIWDIEKRRCIRILNGHSDSVKCLTWEHKQGGSQLAVGSDDGSISIWDIKEGKSIFKSKQTLSPVNCIVWMENGLLMCGTDNQGIFMWSPNNGDLIQIKSLQEGKIYSIIESSPGKCVISAGNDKRLYIWELREEVNEAMCIQQIESGHNEPIRDLVLLPEKRGIVSAANDGRLLYRTLSADGRLISDDFSEFQRYHRDFIYSVTLSGNGKYIISGSTDSSVGIWDASSLEFLTSGKDHDAFVWDVSASPIINDHYFVASASSDGTIRIWDVSNIEAADGFHSVEALEVLPGISLVNCNFSKASIQNQSLYNLIIMNGGIIQNE